jgi:hypothetical protein
VELAHPLSARRYASVLRAIIRALRTANQRINQSQSNLNQRSIKGISSSYRYSTNLNQSQSRPIKESIKAIKAQSKRALIQDKGDLLSKLIELSKQEKDTRSKWMKSLKNFSAFTGR